MKREIQKEMWKAEETYRLNQRYLEEEFQVIADEKRHFKKYLDSLADQLQFISHKQLYEHVETNSAYRILEKAQDEAEHIVKNTNRILEEKLEKNQADYYKQLSTYEEELRVKKRGKVND